MRLFDGVRQRIRGRVVRLAENASGLIGARLALFSLELQEELERQFRHLLLLLATCVFTAFFLLLGSVIVLIAGWQTGYLMSTAIALTVIYGALAVGFAYWLKLKLDEAPPPFAATVAEFERDQNTLRNDDALESPT